MLNRNTGRKSTISLVGNGSYTGITFRNEGVSHGYAIIRFPRHLNGDCRHGGCVAIIPIFCSADTTDQQFQRLHPMSERPLMKDGLGAAAVRRLAEALARGANRTRSAVSAKAGGRTKGSKLKQWTYGFSVDAFVRDALRGLGDMELKQRVMHLIEVMHAHLPTDFAETCTILRHTADHWDAGDPDDSFRGFAAWPLTDYIGVYGLEHPDISLKTLKSLTPLFSAEFAIRPFLAEHGKLTLKHLNKWCGDSDYHVRRLVSEGTRPRLPWGARLPQFIRDPEPVLELLECLKNDPNEIVRRSVANNLNDISKDNPDVVIGTCRGWLDGSEKERQWIVRHATRTLVKSGHPDVFALLGFTASPEITLRSLVLIGKRIRVGEDLKFSFLLESKSKNTQSLVIDYAVHHLKANGRLQPKVFKLKTVDIGHGKRIELSKIHPFRIITTRKYYPGRHKLEILVNGVACAGIDFELSVLDI